MPPLRTIAFYLPQFHPIPENDRWWGPGFTEWTNVAKARPIFPGHYQPHLPGDLGFYDLRVPEVRQAQAELARAYGISAFCYYHYWFGGRRLLERPFTDVLGSGEPNFPFVLCWANENWTRTWDGGASQVLMSQSHSDADDEAHLRYLATAFADPRYVRVDGKPLFLVYRTSQLPNAARTAQTWRDEAHRLGIGELYLCKVDSFDAERAVRPAEIGFDAAVEWVPNWATLGQRMYYSRPWAWARKLRVAPAGPGRNAVLSYEDLVERMLIERIEPTDRVLFPTVIPSWDNTPRRREHAVVFHGATPQLYGRWLRAAVARSVEAAARREPLVFINAWNEWGEGAHLEPDQRWGRAYLEMTRDCVLSAASPE